MNSPKATKIKLDRDGVPVEANDWTEEDWSDLWNFMKRCKRKIAKRHAATGQLQFYGDGMIETTDDAMGTGPTLVQRTTVNRVPGYCICGL